MKKDPRAYSASASGFGITPAVCASMWLDSADLNNEGCAGVLALNWLTQSRAARIRYDRCHFSRQTVRTRLFERLISKQEFCMWLFSRKVFNGAVPLL